MNAITPMPEEKEVTKATELESIFRRVPKWQDLWFYQKSEVLYQMTYTFCDRVLAAVIASLASSTVSPVNSSEFISLYPRPR